MTDVLHVKLVNGNDVYASKGISGSDVWVGFDIYFNTADLPSAGGRYSYLVTVDDTGGVLGADAAMLGYFGGALQWETANTSGDDPITPAVGQWYHIDLHYVPGSPVTSDLYVDGVNINTTGPATDTDTITGVSFGNINPGGWETNQEFYIANPRVGTTQNGTDIWTTDLSGGLGDFDGTTIGSGQTLEVVTNPTGSEPAGATPGPLPGGRVLVAFDDTALEPDPTWTVLDTISSTLVAGIDIHRGRQTEDDQTETSTATVYLHDTDGLFDPANTGSPYFELIDGRQIALQLRNPVTDEWVQQWRGVIDEYGYEINPVLGADGKPIVANIQIGCVDLFDYMAGIEMIPGLFGDTPPSGSEGVVFYEDTATGDGTGFQLRLTQLATDAFAGDAAKTAFWCVFFTGNIELLESMYSPGESILVAMRDAVDAEMPTLANLYTDKQGRIVAHGRGAIFDPDTVWTGIAGTDEARDAVWRFRRWKAGDGTAITLDSDRAQIRPPMTWSRARNRVVNAGLSYPRGIDENQIPDQVFIDDPSRDQYGYRSWSATDLLTKEGTTTGFTGPEETAKFAEFIVTNRSTPKTRVEALTFKAIRPSDPRAASTWALICGIDIADVVNLKVGYPAGTGLDEDMYVQGSDMEIRPAAPEADMVTLTLNITPASYYTDDVGLMGA